MYEEPIADLLKGWLSALFGDTHGNYLHND